MQSILEILITGIFSSHCMQNFFLVPKESEMSRDEPSSFSHQALLCVVIEGPEIQNKETQWNSILLGPVEML